jgi:hypothetical protein
MLAYGKTGPRSAGNLWLSRWTERQSIHQRLNSVRSGGGAEGAS